MFHNNNELEAREEILAMVDEYCKKYITRNSTKRETEYHTQAVCMTARK